MSLDWNYSLSSISTAWDHSREHWWGLIIFKFIGVLESLIEYLCLKYLVYTSKWRVELLFFSISSLINFGIVYTKFDLYTTVWIREFGLQFSSFFFFVFFFFFSSQRELHSVRNIDFFKVGAPTSICHFFCPSVHPSMAYHIPRTIHHLTIIFDTHV